jgi:hypothetical protein
MPLTDSIRPTSASRFIFATHSGWANARNGSGATLVAPTGTNPDYLLGVMAYQPGTYFIYRTFLKFDLSGIGSGAVINAAHFKLWVQANTGSTAKSIVMTQGYQADPVVVANFDTSGYTQRDDTTSFGSQTKLNLAAGAYRTITFNAAGLAAIQAAAGGTLLLCLRDSKDIDDVTDGNANETFYFYSEQESGKQPSIEITDYDSANRIVSTICGIDFSDYILGITTERGRDDELADTGTGTALLTVDNNEGDFSPENTGGAFYPTLDLGCAVVLQEVADGTTYNLFKGTVDKIIPKDAPDVVGRTADIAVLDGMDDMAGTQISTAKRTGTTADVLIGDALDEIGWPAAPGGRTLDAGVDTFEQGWAHRESALEFCQDVARQDGGFFYIDTDGKAIFENRHHRIQGAHLTSRHDFGTAHRDVEYEFSKRFLFNKARITGKTYIVDTSDEFLWSAKTGNNNEAPFVGPGETVTIIAELSGAVDSFTAFGAGGTYWNANSVSDKSGTDLTSDWTVTGTAKGQQVEIAVVNNGSIGGYLVAPDSLPGEVPATLTGQTLLLIGKILLERDIAFVVEDATSQSSYKTRSWELDARFQSRPQQLIAYANHIIARFKDPVPTPVSFSIVAEVDATNRQWALDLKLSDRCTVASTRLGFDQDYYVNKITHVYEIRGSKFSHWVTFRIERTAGAAEGVAWLLGEAGFGELGQKTFLVW